MVSNFTYPGYDYIYELYGYVKDVITPASPAFPAINFFSYKTENSLDKEKFQKFPLTHSFQSSIPQWGQRASPVAQW